MPFLPRRPQALPLHRRAGPIAGPAPDCTMQHQGGMAYIFGDLILHFFHIVIRSIQTTWPRGPYCDCAVKKRSITRKSGCHRQRNTLKEAELHCSPQCRTSNSVCRCACDPPSDYAGQGTAPGPAHICVQAARRGRPGGVLSCAVPGNSGPKRHDEGTSRDVIQQTMWRYGNGETCNPPVGPA